MTLWTSCAEITNCALEVNNDIGVGCSSCAEGYYLSS